MAIGRHIHHLAHEHLQCTAGYIVLVSITSALHVFRSYRCSLFVRPAHTGNKLGGAAQQNLPLAVIAARQTKHTGDGTLRRQNNLSHEVIQPRLSTTVLIAVKATLS